MVGPSDLVFLPVTRDKRASKMQTDLWGGKKRSAGNAFNEQSIRKFAMRTTLRLMEKIENVKKRRGSITVGQMITVFFYSIGAVRSPHSAVWRLPTCFFFLFFIPLECSPTNNHIVFASEANASARTHTCQAFVTKNHRLIVCHVMSNMHWTNIYFRFAFVCCMFGVRAHANILFCAASNNNSNKNVNTVMRKR